MATTQTNPEFMVYSDLLKLIPAATALDIASVAFIEQQDYYQKGDQFTGPKAAPTDTEGQAYLDASFVALPKLGELCSRHVEGVVGREPSFEVVTGEDTPEAATASPDDAEATTGGIKDEIDAVQGRWWDEENLHETTQVFASHLVSSGAAYLRFDIPPGLVVDAQTHEGQIVTAIAVDDWQEALSMIYVEVAAPGTASVYLDPATRQKYSLFSYVEKNGDKNVKCVQASWIKNRDEAGNKLDVPLTVVRIVRDDNSAPEQVEYDTGGVPLVIEARFHPRVFAPFVSPANVSLNNAVNAAGTMAKINVDVAGFPQENHIDIEAATVDVPDPSAEGGVREEDVPLETGPRKAPFYMSAVDETFDPDSEKVVRTPRRGQIVYREPVSSQPILDVLDFWKRGLYEACRQAHILNDISARASGIARVEARSDFAKSLLKTKPKIEGALRKLLLGTRCFAAFLAQDNRIEQFKAARDNVTCHATSGALTPDEKTIVLSIYAAGLYSREEAMVMLGVEDVDAEIAKIEEDAKRMEFGDGWPVQALNAASPNTNPATATASTTGANE